MKANLLLVFVTVSALTAAEAALPARQENRQREYAAPDGGVRVVIVPVSKEVGRSEYESRIEIKSSNGKIACALDYSSEDNEHGFGVVKAEWTPDSQYFVFSLTSSGGHQAWHAPTQFLNRKDGRVRTLDDYFEFGISRADFRIIAPSTVNTELMGVEKPIPVSVNLAALPPLRSWRKSKPFSIDCVGGHVFKPDQP